MHFYLIIFQCLQQMLTFIKLKAISKYLLHNELIIESQMIKHIKRSIKINWLTKELPKI